MKKTKIAALFLLLASFSVASASVAAASNASAEECRGLGFTGLALCSDCDRLEAVVHDAGESWKHRQEEAEGTRSQNSPAWASLARADERRTWHPLPDEKVHFFRVCSSCCPHLPHHSPQKSWVTAGAAAPRRLRRATSSTTGSSSKSAPGISSALAVSLCVARLCPTAPGSPSPLLRPPLAPDRARQPHLPSPAHEQPLVHPAPPQGAPRRPGVHRQARRGLRRAGDGKANPRAVRDAQVPEQGRRGAGGRAGRRLEDGAPPPVPGEEAQGCQGAPAAPAAPAPARCRAEPSPAPAALAAGVASR